MQRRWIAVVMMLAAPAYAAPQGLANVARPQLEPITPPSKVVAPYAAIHVGLSNDPRVSIAQSRVNFRDVGEFQIVTLAVTVTSTGEIWHDAGLTITVPRAARVLGMTYTQNGKSHRADLALAEIARQEYFESTRVQVDPALLEHVSTGREYDHLQLSMYPLSTEQSAGARIVVALPRTQHVIVDLATQRFEHRAGVPAVPTKADVALLAGASVTESHALYVAPAEDTVTEAELRNAMKRSAGQLRACNGSLDTDVHVIARFTIGTDGKVTVGAIDNAPVDLAQCITGVVTTWELRHGKQPVQVSYPLRFGVRHAPVEGVFARR